MCGNWTTGVVIELFGGYWTNKKKKLGFVNIVNTNTFFILVKKLSQSYARMDSHNATFESLKMLLQGRVTIFWAHIFGGGRIFGLLTWEGVKFLGPRFWNNTRPLPPPIVNDHYLISMTLLMCPGMGTQFLIYNARVFE